MMYFFFVSFWAYRADLFTEAMADPYIEQAMMSLNEAWGEAAPGTGMGLTVTCPQLTDLITMLNAEVQSLSRQQRDMKLQCEQHQTVIEMLQADLKSTKKELDEANLRLWRLTSEKEGLVPYPEFMERIQQCAPRDIVAQMDSEVAMVSIALKSAVTRREYESIVRNGELLTSKLEAQRSEMESSLSSLRDRLSVLERDTRQMFDQQASKIAAEAATRDGDITALRRQWDKTAKDFGFELRNLKASLSQSIEDHVRDLLEHLKSHAAAIEALQFEREAHEKALPTQEEVHDLREAMATVRRDIDEASFRVQETYSQCMAMCAAASGTPIAPVVVAEQNSNASQRVKMLPQYMATGSAVDSRSLLEHISGIPASIEMQIEVLKRDMKSVLNVALPSCMSQVSELKDSVHSMYQAHERAQKLVGSLCNCIGISSDGDELMAALACEDYNKAIVQLRAGMTAVAGPGYNFPSMSPRRHHAGGNDRADSTSAARTGQNQSRHDAPDNAEEAVNEVEGAKDMSPPSLTSIKKEIDRERHRANKTPRLGIDIADSIGGGGAQVMQVTPGSAAQRGGLTVGDRIVSMNGKSVTCCRDLMLHISAAIASEKCTVLLDVVAVRGTQRQVTIELGMTK